MICLWLLESSFSENFFSLYLQEKRFVNIAVNANVVRNHKHVSYYLNSTGDINCTVLNILQSTNGFP